VENKEICEESYNNYLSMPYDTNGSYYVEHEDYEWISIKYYRDAGDEDAFMERQYRIPVWLLFNSDEYKAYLDCKTIRDNIIENSIELENTGRNKLVSAQINYNDQTVGNFQDVTTVIGDAAQAKSLREAVIKDIQTIKAQDMINDYNKHVLANITLLYTNNEKANAEKNGVVITNPASSAYSVEEYQYYEDTGMMDGLVQSEWYITDCYTNTIAWMEANGYGDYIKLSEEMWEFAAVCRIDDGNVQNMQSEFEEIPESSDGIEIVTDFARMEKLFKNSRSHSVFGPVADLTTADDGLYRVYFYHFDEDYYGEVYYDDKPEERVPEGAYICRYSAYIEGNKIS